MTDYGLKVKNTKIELQIDGAYRNYVLLDSVDNYALSYGFNDIIISLGLISLFNRLDIPGSTLYYYRQLPKMSIGANSF